MSVHLKRETRNKNNEKKKTKYSVCNRYDIFRKHRKMNLKTIRNNEKSESEDWLQNQNIKATTFQYTDQSELENLINK